MKITAAFILRTGETTPEFVAGYDDIAADEWNGVPGFFTEELSRFDAGEGEIRQLVLNVPDAAVKSLFETPEVPVATTPV